MAGAYNSSIKKLHEKDLNLFSAISYLVKQVLIKT